MASAVRRASGGEGSSKEKPDEVIALPFGRGERSKFREDRNISKPIYRVIRMHGIRRRRDLHFQAAVGNDFKAATVPVIVQLRAIRIRLPGRIEAVLLNQQHVSRNQWGDGMWLVGPNLVNGLQPSMYPIVLIRSRGTGRRARAPARQLG